MVHQVIFLPVGWPWWVAAGAIVVAICGAVWRRHCLGFSAISSSGVFAASAVCWCAYFSASRVAGTHWGIPQPDGTLRSWAVLMGARHGTAMFQVEVLQVPRISIDWVVGRDYIGEGGAASYGSNWVLPGSFYSRTSAWPWLENAGFQVRSRTLPPSPTNWGRHETAIVVPIWFVMLLCLAPPLGWFWRRRWRRRLRVRANRCAACNYDLARPSHRFPILQ